MLAEIAATPIRDIALREPARARSDSAIAQVVDKMVDLGRGAVILEDDDGKIAGIFTERDLIARVAHTDAGWRDTPVREVMTVAPQVVTVQASIAEALEIMHGRRVRNLPVVDDASHAIGILSIRDILAHIVEFFPAEFINLPPNPGSEAHRPWGG
jgi:CBS domain-containing protein